jgi:hypothetical protein
MGKPRKLPSLWDRESTLVKYIRHTLRIMEAECAAREMPRLVFWRNDGSPKLYSRNGETKFLKSDTAGQADFEIAVLGQSRIHIEAKSTKGRLSPYQVEHKARVESVGERYFVVRTPEEFAFALRQCGLDHWSLGKK